MSISILLIDCMSSDFILQLISGIGNQLLEIHIHSDDLYQQKLDSC